MKEISREMAIYLFNRYKCHEDCQVYLLYNDGSFCYPIVMKDIEEHDFIFGIEED